MFFLCDAAYLLVPEYLTSKSNMPVFKNPFSEGVNFNVALLSITLVVPIKYPLM